MSLYPYQAEAVDQIREYFRRGQKRVLLHLPTGGGKTHIFCHVMKATAANGRHCVMAVRGRKLVDQASQRLAHEHVTHGVLMNKHWNINRLSPVQVCSVDTCLARGEFPKADLLVIDEAHMWTGDGAKKFMAQYSDAFVLAVTATPYTKEPLDHLADAVVAPISAEELMLQGFLVRPRYYAPSAPDLSGVKTQNGDYVTSQLESAMATLTGDIVGHWQQLGQGRPTLGFAVNVEHSRALVRQFASAGIPSAHVDANCSDQERAVEVDKLRRGEIKVLWNIGVMGTGVDMPFVSCIIMARPTQSLNLFIQQAGRGTRTVYATGYDLGTTEGRLEAIAKGTKPDFILLDHAGNVIRHGFITQPHDVNLHGNKKEVGEKKPRTCLKCYNVYEGFECPACGWKPESKVRSSEVLIDAEGKLIEMNPNDQMSRVFQFIAEKNDLARRRGYKKGWVYIKVKEEFGDAIAQKMFPGRAKQERFLRRTREDRW